MVVAAVADVIHVVRMVTWLETVVREKVVEDMLKEVVVAAEEVATAVVSLATLQGTVLLEVGVKLWKKALIR